MQLTINGHQYQFIPIQTFRTQWGLPEEFGITTFERKDWEVGAVDSAGQALVEVKRLLVEAMPRSISFNDLLAQPENIAAIFRHHLTQANSLIGLNEEQLDFAIDGLQNVLYDVVYNLAQHHQTAEGEIDDICQHFDFATLYQTWLDHSTLLFVTPHVYYHGDKEFEVRVVSYVYGRVGLQVTIEGQTHYVLDAALACPAANYMENLGETVAQALCQAIAGAE